MPLYDYVCEDCQTVWDVFHGVDSKETNCPKCGGENIKKLIGTTGYRYDHTWDKSKN